MRKLSPLFIFALLITACTKEDIGDPVTPADPGLIEEITNRNELGGFDDIAGFEDCDCYGPFDAIDWENGDPAEIEAQITAALEALTEEELEALFTPVCTEDDFFPNACFAECVGITDYSDCDDYEWGCEGEDFDVLDCYELAFPVTGVFSNGTTVTFNDYAEYFDAIILANEEPELVYPFDVIDYEGNIFSVSSEEELAAIGVDCFGPIDGDWETGGEFYDECFEYLFPMTLLVENDPIVFSTEEELFTWFEAILMDPNTNPEELAIEQGYPIYVRHIETGVEYTANNEQEYFDLYVEHCD